MGNCTSFRCDLSGREIRVQPTMSVPIKEALTSEDRDESHTVPLVDTLHQENRVDDPCIIKGLCRAIDLSRMGAVQPKLEEIILCGCKDYGTYYKTIIDGLHQCCKAAGVEKIPFICFVSQSPFEESEYTCNQYFTAMQCTDNPPSHIIRAPVGTGKKPLPFYMSREDVAEYIARDLMTRHNNEILLVYLHAKKLGATLVRGDTTIENSRTCSNRSWGDHIIKSIHEHFKSKELIENKRVLVLSSLIKFELKKFCIEFCNHGRNVPQGQLVDMEREMLLGIKELKDDIAPWTIFVSVGAHGVPSNRDHGQLKESHVIAKKFPDKLSDGILVVFLAVKEVELTLITRELGNEGQAYCIKLWKAGHWKRAPLTYKRRRPE